MNRSPLSTPSHSMQKQRNAFDLSHHVIFSDSIGLLSPCMSIETIPNEEYTINLESFARSQAVNTSSFMRVKENYDFFFVPFRLLWSPSDQFFTQQNNYDSTTIADRYDDEAPKNIPLIPASAFASGGTVMTNAKNDDVLGFKKQFGYDRIFNQLEYGLWQNGDDITEDQTFLNDSLSRNPFRALAYQKIYRDYFCNEAYETVNPAAYNVDGTAVLSATNGNIATWFTLRYRDLRKDLLTCVRPSFLAENTLPYLSAYETNVYFGNTSASHSGTNIPMNVRNMINGGIQNGIFVKNGTNNNQGTSLQEAANRIGLQPISNMLVPDNIRALLAFEKLSQNIALGGKSYKEQIESRYGIKIPSLRANRSTYLGSFDGQVVISEVLATNGDDLGQIGGKSTSSVQGKTIKFTSLEHGIIMCIHSFIPYTDYYSEMLDKNNTKCYFLDYYQPELDNLGAQPLYGFEMSVLQNANRQYGIHGFVPRYIENKSKLNKVFGTNFSNHYWTAIHRPSSPSISGYGALKVNPSDYNTQFGIAFDGTTKTDQFICRAHFSITKLSPMSVYGLPNYQ